MGTGLYIHIPFCLSRCPYCSFNSYVLEDEAARRYMEALSAEVEVRNPGAAPETVYIGGGTPTVVSPIMLAGVLEKAVCSYRVSPGAETTLEANPGTLDGYDIELLVRAGVNRVSLGAQSFDGAELGLLGRIHSPSDTVRSVRLVRAAGIDNINIDLIYGLPGQKMASWTRTLDVALSLETPHISLYCLSVEEGTPLHRDTVSGVIALPSDGVQAEMYTAAVEMLEGHGLARYEISNFALPGSECAHNINYWKAGDYMGLGAGAYSCLDGLRVENVPGVGEYADMALAGISPAGAVERLSGEDKRREFVMLSLRTGAGLLFDEYRARFGTGFMREYGEPLARLSGAGCLVADDAGIRLTDKGIFASNSVISEFF